MRQLKWLSLLGLLLLGPSTYAQSVRFQSQAISSRGAGIANATVAVCTQPANTNTQPCSPLATLATSTSTTSGGANPLTADSFGNFFFYAAPGRYTVQIYGPAVSGQFVIPDVEVSSTAGGAAGTLSNLNGVCLIDAVKYTTLASAFSDATCSTIDDTGFKSGGTIASTITWPARPITLKLAAAATYTGPASGSVFVINTFSANGSSILGGSAVTTNQQANYGNGTVIKAASSNTSALIQIASGGTNQTLQGFRLENLVLDGNNPGTTASPTANDILYLDAVRNSRFVNISYNNCTGYMIHATATNANANQGTQYNRFDGVFGGGCNGVMLMDGNSTATSSTTLNNIAHVAANFTCGSCAAIEIRQGDGNDFQSIENIFPTNTFTGQCVQVDSPVGGSVEGGLFNYFYKYHVGCAQGAIGGDSFRAKASTKGNEIYAFDAIENQANPVVELSANFSYHISKSNLTEFYGLSTFEYLSWLNGSGAGNQAFDLGIGRCNVGVLCVGNGSSNSDTSGGVTASQFLGAFFISRTANVAGSGLLRLANADTVAFRNAGNTADLSLGVNASNQLTFPANGATSDVGLTGNTAGTHSDSGFYQTASAAGCTTAASIGGTCATPVTITWPVAFADANYKVTCQGSGAITNFPIMGSVTARVAANATVQTMALTAAAASFATIECIAVHN